MLLRILFFTGFISILASNNINAKNNSYEQYYRLVNNAEEAFIKANFNYAFELYDSAFLQYKNPFVKDAYNAAQIAFLTNDTSRFLNYLQVAFSNSMPLECVYIAPIFRKLRDNPNLLKKINSVYNSKVEFQIDPSLKDSIYTILYEELKADSKLDNDTNHLFTLGFKKTNKQNTTLLINYINKGIWASDKLIGIYSDEDYNNFLTRHKLKNPTLSYENTITNNNNIVIEGLIPDSYQLYNKATYIPFFHDRCLFFTVKEKFWEMVEKGYMHPGDFALLEEWGHLPGEASLENTPCSNKDTSAPLYNILFQLRVYDEQGLEAVEKNRKEKYLQKYSVDLEKKKMEKKYGLKLFYGFMHNR